MSLIDFTRRVLGLLRNAVAILLLFCSIAHGQAGMHPRWALHYYGGKSNDYRDQPDCGPLEKFKGNPKTFDYDYDLFGLEATAIKDDVDSERIGEISGFTVYDVIHKIDRGILDDSLIMKMIVVERTPGDFCEIFQQEYESSIVFATSAYFITAGEQVLASTDDMTGSAGFRIEEYWTFDKDGPVSLDLSPIGEIVEELVPAGYSVGNYPYYFERSFDRGPRGGNVATLMIGRVVCTHWIDNRLADGPCGMVRVVFEVKDHKLIAISKAFVPSQ